MVVALALLLPVAVLVLLLQVGKKKANPLAAVMALYVLMPVSAMPLAKFHVRSLEDQIEDLDFQIDLLQYDVGLRERRAEKILQFNNAQLRRYYDLNLRQNIWVFSLGIFCMMLGVAVTGITMFLVIHASSTPKAQVVVGAVGSIGSLLTNFVAAIFLKMHASATSDLGSFHSRLVKTNQVLLGNLLASRIEDDEKRWSTLSELAMNLSK
jgi:hypothetical protein